jgi:hypothetical protein
MFDGDVQVYGVLGIGICGMEERDMYYLRVRLLFRNMD